MTKKPVAKQEKDPLPTKRINKLLAILILLSFITALVCWQLSLRYDGHELGLESPINSAYFIYANIMHGAVFAQAVFAILLIQRQLNKYQARFIRWKVTNLDEREVGVRRRAFERSYNVIALLSLLAYIFSDSIRTTTNMFSSGDLMWPAWAGIIMFFSLPASMAALDKES